jgi:hypothetical protein
MHSTAYQEHHAHTEISADALCPEENMLNGEACLGPCQWKQQQCFWPDAFVPKNSLSGTTHGRTLAELAAEAAPSNTTRTSSYMSSSSLCSSLANATKASSSLTAMSDTNPDSLPSSESSILDGFGRSADDQDKPVVRHLTISNLYFVFQFLI